MCAHTKEHLFCNLHCVVAVVLYIYICIPPRKHHHTVQVVRVITHHCHPLGTTTTATTIATCVRAHNSNSFHALPLMCALTQVAMIAASCTPPSPVLILNWLVVVVVVGVACCCCILFQLVLMLVLTFAPSTLTFAPCACSGSHRQQLMVVVFLPQTLIQILPLHPWWLYPLQLAPVVFFLPPTGTDTGLTLGQLALCGMVRALCSTTRALPVTCVRVGGLRRLEVCA